MFCKLACLKCLNVDVSLQPAAEFISLNDSPLIFVLLVEADFVECNDYFSISIPAFPSITLHHLLILLVVVALCGLL